MSLGFGFASCFFFFVVFVSGVFGCFLCVRGLVCVVRPVLCLFFRGFVGVVGVLFGFGCCCGRSVVFFRYLFVIICAPRCCRGCLDLAGVWLSWRWLGVCVLCMCW